MSTQSKDDQQRLQEELNSRFRGPLMRFFLRRVGQRADAEDMTQDVLLRMVNASSGATRIEHAPSFVFRIAINLLRDRRRKLLRSGTPVFVPIDEVLATDLECQLFEELSPERVLLSKETLVEALRTLGELGPLTRDIFILFRIENMKQKDIAALYGIGQSTVEKHVMKAVAWLAARHGRGTA